MYKMYMCMYMHECMYTYIHTYPLNQIMRALRPSIRVSSLAAVRYAEVSKETYHKAKETY